MKYTLAVAALLSTASAVAPVWSLRSVNDHRTDSQVQKAYGDHSIQQANARDPYQSALLQMESSSDSSDSDEEENVQLNDFQPGQAGRLGNSAYERVIPDRFSADSDDIFMRSVITNYAQEGSDCDDAGDGSPVLPTCKGNGVFTLNKSSALALATEVLGTHKGLSGDALQSYLDTYFDKAWGHFDVMQTGSIAAAKGGALCRFLMSDQRVQLGEAAF